MARSMGNDVPGERSGAERRLVQAPAAIGKPPPVAPDHLDISQQMMAEGDRLRHLQVGEARHDGGHVLLGPVDKCGLKPTAGLVGLVQTRPQPETQIGRDLVVA